MPPKGKEKGSKKKMDIIRIDPKKYEAKIKQSEEIGIAEAAEEELLDEVLLDKEEMADEEEEQEGAWSDNEYILDIGRIDLSFPETATEFANSFLCYPPSYYTLSPKERLLLLYAENFRKQFTTLYPNRRALVLALPNECNVQKLVCSTIRPTAFIQIPLIGNEIECASFVADFITYEPLEAMMKFVSKNIPKEGLVKDLSLSVNTLNTNSSN